MRSSQTAAVAARPMSAEEKKVIFASSLGTVFEWYDFYLYGSLAAIIAKQFFSGLDEGSAFIFALLAFAAGFIVRPFGALVFGRLGDMIGRKYTFLVTILIMGLSTFIVGILPNYASIGVAAPVILIALRMLQGLALGVSTVVRRPMWPNMRPWASAAPTPRGFRPRPRWACSCP
jgi:MFS family permease